MLAVSLTAELDFHSYGFHPQTQPTSTKKYMIYSCTCTEHVQPSYFLFPKQCTLTATIYTGLGIKSNLE